MFSAGTVSMLPNGDLVIDTPLGAIRQVKPVLYQERDGGRVAVDGGYAVLGDKRVGFQVGRYDASRPLVVDPVIQYSTFLGGVKNDVAGAVAVNTAGEAYIAGKTGSPNFPVTTSFGSHFLVDGDSLPFVTKLNATGDAIVYSTYFGSGGPGDNAVGIAAAADGSAIVAGSTSNALGFPATGSIGGHPSEGDPQNGSGVFVLKLTPGGA